MTTLALVAATVTPLVFFMVMLLFMLRHHVKLPVHEAMIVSASGHMRVSFTGGIVFPVVHRAETLDLRTQRLTIARTGMDALTCKDGIRADVTSVMYVAINRTTTDIEAVAQRVGCARASDPATLHGLFDARFTEALKTMAARYTYEQLIGRQAGEALDNLIALCEDDLGGYALETVSLTSVSPADESTYDPHTPAQASGLERLRKLKAES